MAHVGGPRPPQYTTLAGSCASSHGKGQVPVSTAKSVVQDGDGLLVPLRTGACILRQGPPFLSKGAVAADGRDSEPLAVTTVKAPYARVLALHAKPRDKPAEWVSAAACPRSQGTGALPPCSGPILGGVPVATSQAAIHKDGAARPPRRRRSATE